MSLLDGTDSAFEALAVDSITVTRSKGSETADGWSESSTSTVLECDGDAQQGGYRLEQLRGHFETGDVVFFAQDSVTDVQAGDTATIEHAGGRTTTGTVDEVIYDDDSLLISSD